MTIIKEIFSWSVEELRKELCLIEYKSAKLRVSQIKDKFREINEMMDKQLETHKIWDKPIRKSKLRGKTSSRRIKRRLCGGRKT